VRFIPLALPLTACAASWEAVDTAAADGTAPEVYLSAPGMGGTYFVGEAVPLSVVVTDDVSSAEDLLVTVESDLDGLVAQVFPTVDGIVAGTLTLTPGTHTITATATDASGNAGTDTSTILVQEYGLTQPAIRIDPEAPVTGDELVAAIVVDAVDAEGDAVSYVWSWTVDGADAGIAEATVPGEQVEVGQTWVVSVRGTDGENVSPVATREVVVGNSPPVVTTVAIEPEAPTAADTLTCTHDEPIDPEGDDFTVAYAWTVNAVVTDEVTSTLATGQFGRGDLISCQVMLDDGVPATYSSDDVRIDNQAPAITGLSVDPGEATEATTLTCMALGATDPDGDPVTLGYRWFVDGVEAVTGEVIDGNAFARDQELVCEATPADPWATGAPLSSSPIVVADTPPEAPGVAFIRTDLVPGSIAQCGITLGSSDIDGDAVTYAWSWDADGTALAETTDTLDTSDLAPGALLTCLATPSDGTLTGDPGSASLSLGFPTTGDVDAAAADTILVGTASGGGFGKAVDQVQDIDGDGVPELLISAPKGDGAGAGAVYIFSGLAVAAATDLDDTDATWWWYGHSGADNLGGARGLAGAGDCDGDGVGDVLAAANYESTNGEAAGTVYLLYGADGWVAGAGGDIEDDAAARIRGVKGDWLGSRMSSGDIDGDGLSDLLMSAPYNDQGGDKAGLLAVFYGDSARLSGGYELADADAAVLGETEDGELGWSLGAAADGNGDGYGDVAVGIFYDDPGGVTDAGTAVVLDGAELSGTTAYSRVAWLVVHGTEAESRVGYDVTSPGDLDGDGLADFLVGGYRSDAVGTDGGQVGLMYGVTAMNREIDLGEMDAMFFGEGAGDYFGSVATSAGDFDGDGIPDFLLTAPYQDSGATDAGAGYLFTGAEAPTWDATGGAWTARWLGTTESDWFADEAAGGFDLDSDGFDDVAFGSQRSDLGASNGGAVYVFRGP
jgi:hypothetical protein